VIRETPSDPAGQTRAPERPPIPFECLVLEAPEAAAFLKLNLSEFKRLAAGGEIPRHKTTDNRYRYYAYELLDWLLAR
jgi:hypothetical protein